MPFIVTGGHWEDQGYWEEYSAPGWDSDARSIATMAENGAYTFSVGQANGIVCGLTDANTTADYLEITHGFYCETGQYGVIESGILKTSSSYFPVTSVFRIERVEGIVYYSVDGTLVYTSTIPSSGTVFLDCSLYAAGDEILDMAYSDVTTVAYGVNLVLPLPTIEGSILSVTDAAYTLCHAPLPPIELTITSVKDPEIAATLPAIECFIASTGTTVTAVKGVLPAVIGSLRESLLVPKFTAINGQLPPILMTIVGETSTEVAASLPAITGGIVSASTSAFTFLSATVPAPLSYFKTAHGVSGYLTWPRYTIRLVIGSTDSDSYGGGHLRMPAPRLHGTASSTNNRAALRMPAPRLHATSGASAALRMPAPRLTATGSGPTTARAALRMPAPRLTATATTGISASAALRMPAPRLTAQGGANAALRMPLPRLTGAATAAQTANGHLRMPIPRLHGIATVSAVAFGHLRMPMPRLHGGIGNVAHLRMPMPRLTATATSLAVGVVALSVPYAATAAALDAGEVTTYAVNLNTGAVTTLLLGGFDTLATAHGILYGIRGGTLYKLAGDVDGASTAIPMTLRFAQQDFGTNLVKRISTVYLSSREDNGITLDLIQDEKTAWRYQTATDTAPAYGTHKLKVGRGVAFHTAGLIVKNRAGGKLDLGGMEFLIEQLSRKPR